MVEGQGLLLKCDYLSASSGILPQENIWKVERVLHNDALPIITCDGENLGMT